MSMSAGGSIRAVFFDAGGTLLRARPSVGCVYAEVLARFGRTLDPVSLDPLFERRWARGTAHLPEGTDRFSHAPGGTLGFWRALLAGMLADAGEEEPLRDDEFDAVYEAFRSPSRYHVFADVLPTLTALASRGVRMGVISNWDGRLPALLEETGLLRFFPVVVTSGLEGFEKPSARMFDAACARAQVAASHALHVGDSLRDDYEGARGAGLEALYLDRSRERAGSGVIHELTEMLGLPGLFRGAAPCPADAAAAEGGRLR